MIMVVRQFGVQHIVGWKTNMVIPSKEPLVSLGVEIVRLDLSVDKRDYEP